MNVKCDSLFMCYCVDSEKSTLAIRLVIAEPVTITFKLTLNPSNKLSWNFDQFLQPAMERATGLISSMLNATSYGVVPFHQPQHVQYVYHGLTCLLLCFPVLLLAMQGVNLWWCNMASLEFFSHIFWSNHYREVSYTAFHLKPCATSRA